MAHTSYSAKEVMFSSLFVCLSVCLLPTLCKNFQTDLREIFKEGWQWANEQIVTFWWQSASPPGYRDCFHIHHYREIWKVVNGHKSAAASSHSFILIRQMAAFVLLS